MSQALPKMVGWWDDESDQEKADMGEPWETFTWMLHGKEAADSREATFDDLARLLQQLDAEDLDLQSLLNWKPA